MAALVDITMLDHLFIPLIGLSIGTLTLVGIWTLIFVFDEIKALISLKKVNLSLKAELHDVHNDYEVKIKDLTSNFDRERQRLSNESEQNRRDWDKQRNDLERKVCGLESKVDLVDKVASLQQERNAINAKNTSLEQERDAINAKNISLQQEVAVLKLQQLQR